VPTGFTPNNDGKNDVLRPYINEDYTLMEFSIFTRWGEKIFSTSQKDNGWNGKVKGVLQNPGAYVWMIKVMDNINGTLEEAKGSFVLIR
jgi:gliding motility-associated-like protein